MMILCRVTVTVTDNDNFVHMQGDGGGPLTVADYTSGAHTLVGAVSWGIPSNTTSGCAKVTLSIPV